MKDCTYVVHALSFFVNLFCPAKFSADRLLRYYRGSWMCTKKLYDFYFLLDITTVLINVLISFHMSESDSRVTRSSSRSKTIDTNSAKKSIEADFTFYSKVQNDEQESIQVVSKRKLKSNPDTVERLKQSLDKVKN